MRMTSRGARMLLAVALAAAALLASPGVGFATVGGPTVCEVLGWDAGAKRAYVYVASEDGTESFGAVSYFEPAGPDPTRAHEVGWSRQGEGTVNDPALIRLLARLRARLKPMKPVLGSALPIVSTVLATDTLKAWDRSRVRQRVRVTFDARLEFEVLTLDSPTVVRAAEYAIPGRTERVVVLAFLGKAEEDDYEVQVPMLVRAEERGIRKVGWAESE